MNQKKTDVLVAGSGIAGCAAAIEAAAKGAKVVMVERRKTLGGISVTGMGLFACESRLQKLKNHMLTREEAFHHFMNNTHWKANAKLVARYINTSADTIDWLEGMGVEFELLDINWGEGAYNQTGHCVVTPNQGFKKRGGITNFLIKCMVERAESLGVEIITECELVDMSQENGRIAHAVVQSADGEQTDYEVKAVVVTTGGYPHNPELLQNTTGLTLNKNFFMMHNVELNGKGIELAWKMGAGCDGMTIQQCGFTSSIRPNLYPGLPNIPFSHRLTGVVECPLLYVNKHGKRFMDEGLFNKVYKAYQIGRQKDKIAYSILDSDMAEAIETEGVMDVGYMDRDTNTLPNVKEIIEKNAALGTPCIAAADSIEELAEKIGVPAEQLEKTVEEYNAYCESGWDKEFGKDRRYLKPIKSGRYYALIMQLEAYGTVGGIRINENGEAVTDNDDVIPGLYAAGDSANQAIACNEYLAFSLWGSTLGLSCNVGRFAGQSAGDYVKTIE